MAYSEARLEATKKYQAKLKSVSLRVQPEEYEHYKRAADQLALPLRQLFLQGADELIENHLKNV